MLNVAGYICGLSFNFMRTTNMYLFFIGHISLFAVVLHSQWDVIQVLMMWVDVVFVRLNVVELSALVTLCGTLLPYMNLAEVLFNYMCHVSILCWLCVVCDERALYAVQVQPVSFHSTELLLVVWLYSALLIIKLISGHSDRETV